MDRLKVRGLEIRTLRKNRQGRPCVLSRWEQLGRCFRFVLWEQSGGFIYRNARPTARSNAPFRGSVLMRSKDFGLTRITENSRNN